MRRKALPKAITRTPDDLKAIGTSAIAGESRNTSEPLSAKPVLQAEETLAPRTSLPREDQHLVQRQAAARKIVERFRLCAAVGGLFPLPVINVAGVTAINMRMVKALSNLYGTPFESDRTRSIIMGFIGGAAPTGLATATASTLALVAPGSALIGLAVSSFSAAAFTRGIGSAFIERFEKATQTKS